MRTFTARTFPNLALASALMFPYAGLAGQQPPANGVEIQRAAMKKLAFLTGSWLGPVSIVRGPGDPLRLTQSERVEWKLDGLVLLIEGKSTGADGKTRFEALATIAYDEAAHAYRMRAYNEGHYVDTELTALGDGFSWGFQAGPARVENTMHLTAKGEWQETTEVVMGNDPPRKSVEMVLEKRD
jgi:hypothetical protein